MTTEDNPLLLNLSHLLSPKDSERQYKIDLYQREYVWNKDNLTDLMEDLVGEFKNNNPEQNSSISEYSDYFLGSIIIEKNRSDGSYFIVDGQQRLTSLTLLLILLYRQLKETQPNTCEMIHPLIRFYGGSDTPRLRINSEERNPLILKLMDTANKSSEALKEYKKSQVRSLNHIAKAYDNLEGLYNRLLAGEPTENISRFAKWLVTKIHLVTIEPPNSKSAYRIFETMNDRGQKPTFVDMFKGFLVSNIGDRTLREECNQIWKQGIDMLENGKPGRSKDFIRDWLRCHHSKNVDDYKSIGSEKRIHRWAREKRNIDLTTSGKCANFINKDFAFYQELYTQLHAYSDQYNKAYSSLYFNKYDMTVALQYPIIMSAIFPSEAQEIIEKKIKIVSRYLEIWLARKNWAGQSTYTRDQHSSFGNLMMEIREKGKICNEIVDFAHKIKELLCESDKPNLRTEEFQMSSLEMTYKSQGKSALRSMLARMADYIHIHKVEENSSVYEDFVKLEVEHIIGSNYDRFSTEHNIGQNEGEFNITRDRLGALVLLSRGENRSIQDVSYDRKLVKYSAATNPLAASLTTNFYKNSPDLQRFIEKNKLENLLKPHETFNMESIREREELYCELAKLIWDPDQLIRIAETNPSDPYP